MKTQVHKVTLLIVDHDDCGADGVKDVLENTRYPNRCIDPTVMDVQTQEVEWSDDHPLNMLDQQTAEYRRMFESPAATGGKTSG